MVSLTVHAEEIRSYCVGRGTNLFTEAMGSNFQACMDPYFITLQLKYTDSLIPNCGRLNLQVDTYAH